MNGHALITLIVPFDATRTERTQEVIRQYRQGDRDNQPVAAIRAALDNNEAIHFLSIVVIDPQCPSETLAPPRDAPAHLIIEMSSDLHLNATLDLLLAAMAEPLRAIVEAATGKAIDDLRRFLVKHHRAMGPSWLKRVLGLNVDGTPGMSVRRIREERDLAYELDRHIRQRANTAQWLAMSPRQRLEEIREIFWSQGRWKWAFTPEAAPCMVADPHSDWNLDLSLKNPRARKALLQILITFSLPMLLFLVAVIATFYLCEMGVTDLPFGLYLHCPFSFAATRLIAVFVLALTLGAYAAFYFARFFGVRGRRFWLVPLILGFAPLAKLFYLDEEPVKSFVLVMTITFVVALVFLSFALVLFYLGYKYLRVLENLEEVEDAQPDSQREAWLGSFEDRAALNHFTAVSRIKPVRFRRWFILRLSLIAVKAGTLLSPPGFVGRNSAIHFARWIKLPGTTQLLFLSNYDGTWPAYVVDFIAEAPGGVTGIWSNCVGFPYTKRLFTGGAEERDHLVRWARRQQIPTPFWYAAYPDLTTQRIRIHAGIRQGLASARSEADVRDWFSLFSSMPRTPEAIETAEVSTLMFGAMRGLPHALCVPLAFRGLDRGESARNWLRAIEPYMTYGELTPERDCAAAVALSSHGLSALISARAMATFPPAFQQGMDARGRQLGDSDPAQWTWGSQGRYTDAVLFLYGANRLMLQNLYANVVEEHGAWIEWGKIDLLPAPTGSRLQEQFRQVFCVEPRANSADKRYSTEPFGFVDGLSQPLIRGLRAAPDEDTRQDWVEPGEFILGYPDNTRRLPIPPRLPAEEDPTHHLPTHGPDPMRRRPEFSRYEGAGYRDIGLNGSFVVVRQLQQDVAGFERFLSDAERQVRAAQPELAARIGHQVNLREWIAAKVMGRWRSGASLLARPHSPLATGDAEQARRLAEPDLDFRFSTLDPEGRRCPFGAHIRRANPRDTRKQGDPVDLASVNRHRLLRRGRSYVSGEHQGLMFVCLNADIERQFEFVQRNWLLDRYMHGLPGEVDPLIGGGTPFTLPTEGGPVILNIPPLVTCVGGGYYFLPGRRFLRFLARAA